jgi:hypothetical protein
MFANEPEDEELNRARDENDLLLKGKFEAIFAKYSEDFTGVGDEIDLETGKIVVDNGHLKSMQNETDVGSPVLRSASPHVESWVANGRSMLRAMTVAPDRDDSYFEEEGANDVIESIESLATVINISSDEEEEHEDDGDDEADEGDDESEDVDEYQDDDEDDPIAPEPKVRIKSEFSPVKPRHKPSQQQVEVVSDSDSLFEVKQENRESSPDSLFFGEEDTPPTSTSDQRNSEEQEIIAKFGQNVGREVLDFLNKRDQEERHIESAWRIPVIPDKLQPGPAKSSGATGDIMPSFKQSELHQSPTSKSSLWQLARKRRSKSEIRRDTLKQQIRDESEDPLQDGFNSAEEDEDSEFQEDPDEETDIKNCTRILKKGVCPWCKYDCGGFDKALTHMRRAMRAHRMGRPPQPGHNIDHMMRVRPKIMARKGVRGTTTQEPRLLVSDFKTLVQLHEGAGKDFDEIQADGLLRNGTRDLDEIVTLYYKHRGLEEEGRGQITTNRWTIKEKRRLAELSNKATTNMDTIRRSIRGRSNGEIGAVLAARWLREFRGLAPEEANDDDEEEEEEEAAAQQQNPLMTLQPLPPAPIETVPPPPGMPYSAPHPAFYEPGTALPNMLYQPPPAQAQSIEHNPNIDPLLMGMTGPVSPPRAMPTPVLGDEVEPNPRY